LYYSSFTSDSTNLSSATQHYQKKVEKEGEWMDEWERRGKIYTYNIWGSTNRQVSPRVTLTIFWKKKQKKITRRRKHYTWQIVRLGKKTSHEPMVLLGQNEWTNPIFIGGGKIRVSENVFSVCLAMAFPEACMALQMPIPAVVQNNDRAPFR